MFRLLLIVCAAWVAICPVSAGAQSDDPAASRAPADRSERLDIFGAGMCHTCEWRPRDSAKRAADQCGVGDDGLGRMALFECGRNPACEPVCNFVRCE